MNKKSILVPEGTFHSKLSPVAAILLSVAAVTGLLSILCAFIPGSLAVLEAISANEMMNDAFIIIHALSNKLTRADVADHVTLTWMLIHSCAILFGAVGSIFLTIGLLLAKRGNLSRGADVIVRGAKILYYMTTAAGIGAAALFLIRIVPYILIHMHDVSGADILFLLPGLMSEFVLATLLGFIILKLRRFFDCAGDCALSIFNTLSSGILRYPAISSTPAVGCLLLGLSGLCFAWNRISTICSCAYPTADILILYFSAAMFLSGSAAAILLFFYLRNFKRSSEYLLYKGTPVEEEPAANN